MKQTYFWVLTKDKEATGGYRDTRKQAQADVVQMDKHFPNSAPHFIRETDDKFLTILEEK